MVLGPTQPPIQWVPGALSLGVKRPRREADHSHPSSAEVNECVELYHHSSVRLHGVVLSYSRGGGVFEARLSATRGEGTARQGKARRDSNLKKNPHWMLLMRMRLRTLNEVRGWSCSRCCMIRHWDHPRFTRRSLDLQHAVTNTIRTLVSLPPQWARPSWSRCSRDTNPVPSGSQSAKTARSCCRLIVHVRFRSDSGCDVTEGIVAGITVTGQHHRYVMAGFLTSRPETSGNWNVRVEFLGCSLFFLFLHMNSTTWTRKDNRKCIQNFDLETS
jgi:hypothetical protein